MVPLIAIVDDDDSFRRATTSFIRSLGYAVLQFGSAEAFLQSDRLHHADCLISDVQMPGMNGIELQSKLTVQGYRLPIIFVTAFSEMRARAQALSAGAIGFLAKPFSDEELVACLDKALAAKGVYGIPPGLRHRNCMVDEAPNITSHMASSKTAAVVFYMSCAAIRKAKAGCD